MPRFTLLLSKSHFPPRFGLGKSLSFRPRALSSMDDYQKPPMRYAALDPLRGLAAVWVFLFHYSFTSTFQSTFPLLHTFLKAGDRGVPMFFVISGYCLAMAASQSIQRDGSIGEFLYRRAKRIFPAFWCSIVVIVLLRWATWSVARSCSIIYDLPLMHDWKRWMMVVTLTPMFDQSDGTMYFLRMAHINCAYWTLPIEFQFYLVVSAALLAPRWFYPILAAVTLASMPVYFIATWNFRFACEGVFLVYWLPFACGLALYWMLDRGVTPNMAFGRYAGSVSTVGSIVLVSVFMVLTARKVEVERLAFAVGLTTLLWLANPIDGRVEEFLQRKRGVTGFLAKCLILLGAMSYSLYLIHNEAWYTIAFALRQFIPTGTSLSELTIDLSAVVGVFVICYPFYRCCEAPFVGGRKNRQRTPPAIPLHSSTAQDAPLAKAA